MNFDRNNLLDKDCLICLESIDIEEQICILVWQKQYIFNICIVLYISFNYISKLRCAQHKIVWC
jgi:hypothetical protein